MKFNNPIQLKPQVRLRLKPLGNKHLLLKDYKLTTSEKYLKTIVKEKPINSELMDNKGLECVFSKLTFKY
ncbi:hypothetical protein T190611E02C_30204 [Tenacibaculum sp. 190524A05c]